MRSSRLRLAGIEEHLARLVDDVEPLRDDAGVDERLERLREQVEGLKSGPEGRSPRTTRSHRYVAPVPRRTRPQASPPGQSRPGQCVRHPAAATPAQRRTRRRRVPLWPPGQGVSFWELLGAGPQSALVSC